MELHTLKEKEMSLLSRKRISLMAEGTTSTPSRLETLKAVAGKYRVSEDKVVIRHVYPQFGTNKAKVIAHIYDDKDKLALFEGAGMVQKHKPKEAPKAE